jgi:hypothetical protein
MVLAFPTFTIIQCHIIPFYPFGETFFFVSYRTTSAQRVDYFKDFLAKYPTAEIESRTINIGCNKAIDTGLYTFRLKDGKELRARYTFTYRWNKNKWLISSHHSSLPPGNHSYLWGFGMAIYRTFVAAYWIQQKQKNYLTTSSSPFIIVLKLFIYLRNLCSGLMIKNLGYLVSHCLNFYTMCTSRLFKTSGFYLYKLKRAYKSFKTV